MKNYLIENGKAYQIEGEKAYEMNFFFDGSIKTNRNKSIDVKGKEKFSFYELERKLNLQNMIIEENSAVSTTKNEDKALKGIKESAKETTESERKLKK